MNKGQENALAWIMGWMDENLDERGVRKAPRRNTVIASGHSIHVPQLQGKGYLQYTRNGIYPTAKAQAWWIRRKGGASRF